MKTEKTFWFIFIGAFVLRLLNVPGHGILTVFDLGLLSILYFPLSFYFFSDKEIKRQNIALSIVSGVFLSIIPIGIMFKLQHYPGQFLFMIIGLVSGLTLFVLTYILRKKCNDDLQTYYKNMFKRTLILSVAAIVFTLLPSKTIIQIQYHNDPELVRLSIQVIENPDNDQFREDLQKYYQKNDSIEFSKIRKK